MKTEKEKKQLKPNTRSMLKYKCSFGEMKKKTTSLIHSSTSLDVIYCFSFSIFFSHSTFSRAGRYMSTLNPAPVYVVLKPPDSCHNEPGSDCGKNMHGSRFAKMRDEKQRPGLLLIAQHSQPRCTCSLAIYASIHMQTQSQPQIFNNELPSCAKTWDREKKSEQLGTMSFFCASPAAGILSAQSSHRHLNLPLLHPIPAVALFKSLPPPSPPHF